MPVKITVIVPIYNEEKNIAELSLSLQNTLHQMNEDYEIIFVDDASTDGSFSLLKEISATEPHIKIIQFRRNCGQTAALMAGINNSKGEIVVTIDGDLQNDPADIPILIEKLGEGYDLVSGWRKERHDSFFTRVLPSLIANKLISMISGVFLKDYGCTLKVYKGQMIRELKLYGEMHRFIPIFMAWEGATIAEIPVKHHPRQHGLSKYGLSRIFKVSLDLITIKFLEAYSTKPIYIFGGFGMALVLFGIIMGLGGMVFGVERAGLMGGIFMVMGFQFLFLGILAELIIRTYHESTERKIYEIRRKINF